MVCKKSANAGRSALFAKTQLPEQKQGLPNDHAGAIAHRLFEVTRRSSNEERERHLVTGSTLRELLDISAPTLWRWRQTPGFPQARTINNRNYFVWAEVLVWLENRAGQQ
jgi:hypothetical protein